MVRANTMAIVGSTSAVHWYFGFKNTLELLTTRQIQLGWGETSRFEFCVIPGTWNRSGIRSAFLSGCNGILKYRIHERQNEQSDIFNLDMFFVSARLCSNGVTQLERVNWSSSLLNWDRNSGHHASNTFYLQREWVVKWKNVFWVPFQSPYWG